MGRPLRRPTFVRIYDLSGGVPRLVNLLCDRALWHGSQISPSVIDAGLIDAAAQDLALASPVGDRRLIVRGVLTAVILVALTLVGAAGAACVFRDDARRVFLQWLNVPQPPGGPVRLLPAPLAPILPPEAVYIGCIAGLSGPRPDATPKGSSRFQIADCRLNRQSQRLAFGSYGSACASGWPGAGFPRRPGCGSLAPSGMRGPNVTFPLRISLMRNGTSSATASAMATRMPKDIA